MSALDSHAKTHLLSCELMLDDGEVCTCFRDEAAAELAALRQERDALRAVVEAARKEHSLLNSVMNWMQEEKIEIPFIMGVLVGSLGEADEQLAAVLARVDGKGEK